ncbi:MAG: beta-lactamase family protein [Chloroflexi bacterium]|nr:beta-lactamase family protein [Chloroflexota bacterium]
MDTLHATVGDAIGRGLAEGRMPGAVVLVWHAGEIRLREAYGWRSRWEDTTHELSDPEPMTTDTVFDIASLTKLFTATRIMQLVEQRLVQLDTPVAHFVPEFELNGKDGVTVRQLLSHTGGLLSGLPLWQLEPSIEARLQRALREPATDPPATLFRYSDFSFITLGELAQRVDGRLLAVQIREHIIDPLDMRATTFNPGQELRLRIAPTEWSAERGGIVRGIVHDENAWSLGGVAGHAGLFSTADDLLQFALAHLQHGARKGIPLLHETSAVEMQRLQTGYLASGANRGLGWELNQRYYMGAFQSLATFGHTGFTGTSVVIHPPSETIVLVLANRVHPTRNGPPFNPVREATAMAVAEAVGVY